MSIKEKKDSDSIISNAHFFNSMIDNEAGKIEQDFRQHLNKRQSSEQAIDTLVKRTAMNLAKLNARMQVVETILTADLKPHNKTADTEANTVNAESTDNTQKQLAAATPDLPLQQILNADIFKNDKNMHDLETTDNGLTYCWSGKNPQLVFSALISREQQMQVKVRLVNAIKPELMQQAKLCVNGAQIKHSIKFDGTLNCFMATLPAAKGKTSETELNIELPGVYSPKELGESEDIRKLGLAVHSVEFGPLPPKKTILNWLRNRF